MLLNGKPELLCQHSKVNSMNILETDSVSNMLCFDFFCILKSTHTFALIQFTRAVQNHGLVRARVTRNHFSRFLWLLQSGAADTVRWRVNQEGWMWKVWFHRPPETLNTQTQKLYWQNSPRKTVTQYPLKMGTHRRNVQQEKRV